MNLSDFRSTLFILGLLFALIFAFGFWLKRTGKPYSSLLLTVHKLAGLGTGVYLGALAYRVAPLEPIGIISAALALLTFLILIVSGGLVSIPRPAPAAASLAHHWLPYLALLASGVATYLALGNGLF